MAYTIKEDIVVPNGYVYRNSNLQPGFHKNHLHSTGNLASDNIVWKNLPTI